MTAWPGVPLFGEIEKDNIADSRSILGFQSLTIFDQRRRRWRRAVNTHADALLKSEHLKFGLKGCLAASLCYIIYSSLFWPEISTSVTTCFLTALTTIGASHQKQVLRFAGALIGGFVFGMGAQVFSSPTSTRLLGSPCCSSW